MRPFWTLIGLLGGVMLSAATPSELTIRYAEALAAGDGSASQELVDPQAKKAAALKLLATMPKCGVRMDDVSGIACRQHL